METLLKFLGAALLAAVIFVGYSLLSGYIVYKFWGWFILPVFPFLPIITIIQGIGIGMFISLFGRDTTVYLKDEYQSESAKYMIGIKPFIVLLVGYLVHIIFY